MTITVILVRSHKCRHDGNQTAKPSIIYKKQNKIMNFRHTDILSVNMGESRTGICADLLRAKTPEETMTFPTSIIISTHNSHE